MFKKEWTVLFKNDGQNKEAIKNYLNSRLGTKVFGVKELESPVDPDFKVIAFYMTTIGLMIPRKFIRELNLKTLYKEKDIFYPLEEES